MRDQWGRAITYVRVSVTDRCNLRCQYCMPQEGVPFLPHEAILRFEEIVQAVQALAACGVSRVKLTGGEPLCRKNLPQLVRMLYDVPGIEEVTLTTNGILLPQQAKELFDAGILRVNVSLDTLKPERYAKMTRCGKLNDALAGLRMTTSPGCAIAFAVRTAAAKSGTSMISGFSLPAACSTHARILGAVAPVSSKVFTC